MAVALLVRPAPHGKYRIIDGHRRFLILKELANERGEELLLVPCRIFHNVTEADVDAIRFEVQDNVEAWDPATREAFFTRYQRLAGLNSIAEAKGELGDRSTSRDEAHEWSSLPEAIRRLCDDANLARTYRQAIGRIVRNSQRSGYAPAEVVALIKKIMDEIQRGVITQAR